MTNEKNPPAFPHSRLGSDCDGMSLRDYFAAKAMQGLCANCDFTNSSYDHIANVAYKQANAMINARAIDNYKRGTDL